MSTNYVTERPAGREHIPLYPKGFIATRIIQLILGIVCLGLTAYAVTILPFDGAALMLFTSIVTLITSIYILVAHFGPPKAYNYWAILGLDIFHVFFWLIAFALLAARAALIIDVSTGSSIYYYGYDEYGTIYGSICAAAAGLGAVNWLTYVIALILHSIALHRHRKAGLHAMPNNGDVNGNGSNGPTVSPGVTNAGMGVPAGGEKVEMQPQQPQSYYGNVQSPSPQVYSPVQQSMTSQGYPPVQPTPPPQNTYEAPHAGIAPAERIHEAA